MPDQPDPSPEQQLGLERIVFFSDAVMAIAITLLALNMHVPEIDPAQATALLPARLSAIGPSFMTFFISFLVIGIYWISHHRYFGYIRCYDTRLILLNLLFLFFIICMPFLASLLGQYVFVPIALVAYSLAIAALGLSMALIWWYASYHHRLIDSAVPQDEIRIINIRLFVAPLMFVLAVPFAYVSSTAVIAVWWLSPFVVLLATRLSGRRSVTGGSTRVRR
jgi:uncharacterized membrane protein